LGLKSKIKIIYHFLPLFTTLLISINLDRIFLTNFERNKVIHHMFEVQFICHKK